MVFIRMGAVVSVMTTGEEKVAVVDFDVEAIEEVSPHIIALSEEEFESLVTEGKVRPANFSVAFSGVELDSAGAIVKRHGEV